MIVQPSEDVCASLTSLDVALLIQGSVKIQSQDLALVRVYSTKKRDLLTNTAGLVWYQPDLLFHPLGSTATI